MGCFCLTSAYRALATASPTLSWPTRFVQGVEQVRRRGCSLRSDDLGERADDGAGSRRR